MFERFTDRARRVLVLAQEEARLLNHGFIGTEHLLLGLLHEGDGVAAKALTSLDISLDAVRDEVEKSIGAGGGEASGSPPFTPKAKKALELSLREALQLGHHYIATEHLLLGLVREGDGGAAQVLAALGADAVKVREAVIRQLSASRGAEYVGALEVNEMLGSRGGQLLPARGTERRRRSPLTSIGDSWSIEVVRPGRNPEVFAEAYERLGELLEERGGTLEDSRVWVTSVETDEGPGLRLSVRHSTGGGSGSPESAGGQEPEAGPPSG